MHKLIISLIILLAFTGCVLPTYIGQSTLNETGVKKSDIKYATVLVVGAGSMPSRFFLENLSEEIMKLFKQHKIEADFTYLGKIPRRSHVDVNKLVTSKYNAYLIFHSMDTSYSNTHKDVAIVAATIPGGFASGSVIGNQYKEDFYAEFYTNVDSLNRVWQGELKVDFDFAKTTRYETIAKDLFEKLLKNGLIPKN